MALKATICKAELNIADMDRHYYHLHALTLAQHHSETDIRVMLRVLVFALNGHEDLMFTKGLSTQDEPDLWHKSLSDEIELWIDLGQPDEKRIRQACGKAKRVRLYSYGGRSDELWWGQMQDKVQRFNNLEVYRIDETPFEAIAAMRAKSMQLNCTIQDGQVWFGDDNHSAEVSVTQLFPNR